MKFFPTYLYIKRHSQTGLLYFGKKSVKPTDRIDIVEHYSGSGRYWLDHIKKHGKNIETIWYCLFTEKRELVATALSLSSNMDIITGKREGKKVFANLMNENGLWGGCTGRICSEEERKRISETHWSRGLFGENNPHFGKKRPERTRKLISEKALGNNRTLGMKHSPETKHIWSDKRKGRNFLSPEESERKITEATEILKLFDSSRDVVFQQFAKEIRTGTSYKTCLIRFIETSNIFSLTHHQIRSIIEKKTLSSKEAYRRIHGI